MHIYNFVFYTLILSHDPCDVFKYYNVTEMHGLNLKDCSEYNNTTIDAYIAGWTNIAPDNGKPFVFINLARCTDDVKTTGLVMHEMSHLFWLLNYDNLKEREEEIITNAEEEAYKIVKLIKELKHG